MDGHRPGPSPSASAPVPRAAAPGLDLPVVTHRLASGLTLLVLPRGEAPIATFYTQFNIGSVNEVPGVTGVSHLLEHMLKKGTTRVGTRDWEAERACFPTIDALAAQLHAERQAPGVPDSQRAATLEQALRAAEDEARRFIVPEEYDLILKRHGGRHRNATTSPDRTNFFVSLPAERAELWFALEADRLRDLVFRDFYRERDVVMEERRRSYETQPWGLLREHLLLTAYERHPYRHPTIGHMRDLELMDRPTVEAHFRRYYGARNCVAVVVGRVDPGHMIALAERWLGALPPGEPIPPVLDREPEQRAERRVRVAYDAEPHLMVGWHVPGADHADAAALSLLAAVLTEGRTSRLYRALVLEERIATEVSATMSPLRDDRLFVISALPRRPFGAEDVIARVEGELERLVQGGVTADELARVRTRREAHEYRRLQSNLGLAWQLGISQGLWGDWRFTFEAALRAAEVGPGEIVRVAARYLGRSRRTVAILERDGAPPADLPR